jgi:hypothetical protein
MFGLMNECKRRDVFEARGKKPEARGHPFWLLASDFLLLASDPNF